MTTEPPLSLTIDEYDSLKSRLEKFSKSDYALLKKLELPKFLQEQLGRGVTRMSLGGSTIGPDGIEEGFERLERGRSKLDELGKSKPKAPKP